MSFVRKLVLLAMAVGVLSLMGASTASAVEVIKEAGTKTMHCSGTVREGDASKGEPEFVVTTSGTQEECKIRGEANDLELGGLFGAMVVCDVHLEGYISEAGKVVGDYTIEPTCEASSAVKCTGVGDRHINGEITGGKDPSFTIEGNFCVVAFGITIRCHVNGTVSHLGSHKYVMSFVHTNKCEQSAANSLQGDFNIVVDANHTGIEIK